MGDEKIQMNVHFIKCLLIDMVREPVFVKKLQPAMR